MTDPVRVTLETDDDEQSVRFHDDDGELSVGDATFRFEVSGPNTGEDTDAVGSQGAGTETGSADGTPDSERESTETEVDDSSYITEVDRIPANGTHRFEAVDGKYGVEGILQHTDEGVLGWENSCPHKPEVRLDKGFGALVNDGQLVCHKHGARFNADDGFCTRGPCRGSVLAAIDVEERDGAVYLVDERFEAVYSLDD